MAPYKPTIIFHQFYFFWKYPFFLHLIYEPIFAIRTIASMKKKRMNEWTSKILQMRPHIQRFMNKKRRICSPYSANMARNMFLLDFPILPKECSTYKKFSSSSSFMVRQIQDKSKLFSGVWSRKLATKNAKAMQIAQKRKLHLKFKFSIALHVRILIFYRLPSFPLFLFLSFVLWNSCSGRRQKYIEISLPEKLSHSSITSHRC